MAPFLGQTLLFPGRWAPNPQLLDSLGISSKARQLSLRTPSRPQQGPEAQAAAGGLLCPSRPHITDRPWGTEWQQQDDQIPQPGAVLWGGSRSSELCLGHLWGHPAESPGQMLLCHCYSVTMRTQSLPCLGPGFQVGQMTTPRALAAQPPALRAAPAMAAPGPSADGCRECFCTGICVWPSRSPLTALETFLLDSVVGAEMEGDTLGAPGRPWLGGQGTGLP